MMDIAEKFTNFIFKKCIRMNYKNNIEKLQTDDLRISEF